MPLADVLADQHFTEPPPRYSEASLVKTLEEYGIGRPSTYASIIQALLNREYVMLDSRRFRPTDVGRAVAKFLSGHFTQYVDYDFTAKLEDELDAVSRGEEDWVPLMREVLDAVQGTGRRKDRNRRPRRSHRRARARRRSGHPASRSVRLGRYGPMAQIGAKDDEEKPRFASLRPGQSIHTITLEDALQLFKLPRDLGAAEDGEEISVGVGRFGPFVKHGKIYASLKPRTIRTRSSCERAKQLLHEKAEAGRNRVIAEFRRRRDPGAARPLRPLHHRRQQERAHPEGSRAQVADRGRMRGAARRGAGQAGARPLRTRGENGGREECRRRHRAKKAAAKKAPAKKAAAKKPAKKAPRRRPPPKRPRRRKPLQERSQCRAVTRPIWKPPSRRCARGGVLAYPTEAVYGLGCDPHDETRSTRLFALKRRPPTQGVLLIAADFAQVAALRRLDGVAPEARCARARELAGSEHLDLSALAGRAALDRRRPRGHRPARDRPSPAAALCRALRRRAGVHQRQPPWRAAGAIAAEVRALSARNLRVFLSRGGRAGRPTAIRDAISGNIIGRSRGSGSVGDVETGEAARLQRAAAA